MWIAEVNEKSLTSAGFESTTSGEDHHRGNYGIVIRGNIARGLNRTVVLMALIEIISFYIHRIAWVLRGSHNL